MLSPQQLAAFQAAAGKTLDLSATIERNSSNTLDVGQPTAVWTALSGMPVACSMRQPSQAQATQYAGLIGVQQASVFSFAYGQDCQRNDRVIVNGTTWTVEAQLGPLSYPVLAQVLATKVG